MHILVVEDSEPDFRLMVEYLKESHTPSFEITRAKDLRGALKAIAEKKFDAILTDLGLPDSRGLPTLENISKVAPRLPIVVLTGHDDQDTGVAALQKKAQDYLVKGCIHGGLLSRSIRYAIERKRAEETLRQNQELLSLSMEAASAGSWDWDLVTGKLVWSEEYYELCGLKPQKVKPTLRDWLKSIHPDDRNRVKQEVGAALRRRRGGGREILVDTEFRINHPEKGLRWLNAKGEVLSDEAQKPLRMTGIAIDITEHKRAQEKIRHLASFPQLNPNPIIELDENGKIIFSNLAAIKALKELKVPKQLKLFLPEDFAHIFKMFKSGKSKEFMSEVRIKERFFIESLAFIPELKVARIYARDITHRKNAEELLKKAHDELDEKVCYRTQELVQANRKLLEEIAKRKETEKQIIARNAMLKLLNRSASRKQYADSLVKLLKGWSKCGCVGLRLLDYEGKIPYESYTGFGREFWEAENWLCVKTDNCACTRVIQGKVEAVDKQFMSKQGSFYCNDMLQLIRLLPKAEEDKFRGVCIRNGFCSVSVVPIKHRDKILGAIHLADKEQNKMSLALKQFLDMLSELIGEGVNKFNLEEKIHKDHFLLDAFFRHSISPFVFLDRDFNFIRVNEAFAAACGRGISEFLGHNYFEYCPDTEKEAIFRSVIVTKAPHQAIAGQFECLNLPGEGASYWDWGIIPILDEEREVFLLVLSLKDVTEEKRHEEKLSTAQRELEQARRLSDIGTLAATVAHELRNPLAAINMAASNIRRKANNPDLERHLFNIEKKVTESDQIISNLLFYSRIKPPHCENINLSDIINECVDGTQGRLEKKISVEVELDAIKDIRISADPLQMKEVFSNILNNACDAVPGTRGRIEITATDADSMVKVSISDNGCGIDKFHLESVFDPFFTTKAKGTGLGLAVCNQIVTLHKGTISIESELEKGTTVTVCLPKKGNGY